MVQTEGCFSVVYFMYQTAVLGEPRCACVSSVFFETVNFNLQLTGKLGSVIVRISGILKLPT
jgi:hypothetical protein